MLALVAVESAPCVHNNTLLSPPVCVQSKSEPAVSPVAPTANVALLLLPVALYVQDVVFPCKILAAIELLDPI